MHVRAAEGVDAVGEVTMDEVEARPHVRWGPGGEVGAEDGRWGRNGCGNGRMGGRGDGRRRSGRGAIRLRGGPPYGFHPPSRSGCDHIPNSCCDGLDDLRAAAVVHAT